MIKNLIKRYLDIEYLDLDLENLLESNRRLRNYVDNSIENSKKSVMENIMADFTTFGLSIRDDNIRPFELVNMSTGKFVVSAGYLTEEEAIEAAKIVAVQHPTIKFAVYAPIKYVQAEIPVVVSDTE